MLDGELLVRRNLSASFLDPIPPAALVEDDVVQDTHTLCRRVEDAVRLGAVGVADEDARDATIVELVKLR